MIVITSSSAGGEDLSEKIIGRERERELLADLLAGVEDGGAALVIRGPAGIGKSSLLALAMEDAQRRGMTVLATTGVPSEAQMAFAGLHQLVRGRPAERERLPEIQRNAIEAAFGLVDAPAPEFFFIALATLDLLAEVAVEAPVLIIVDDAQWLDAASIDVLAFVARRLAAEPIVLLFAARDGFESRLDLQGLTELGLGGLTPPSASLLLDATAPALSQNARQRVLDESSGNPLALLELPRALSTELDADVSLGAPLQVTERLERAFGGRSAELPDTAQALLLLAALDDHGALKDLCAAASLLLDRQVDAGDLTPAIDAQLVTVDRTSVRFRHPLVRSALFQAASVHERYRANAALAEIYRDDIDRGVWYRAASIIGPDEDVSLSLERAAERAARRGAASLAAEALERAAELTTDRTRRGRLLVAAADGEFHLGRVERSVALLREAELLDLDEEARTRLAFLLEVADEAPWSGGARIQTFVEIADKLVAAGDNKRALGALTAVAFRCYWGNPEPRVRETLADAAERIPGAAGSLTLMTLFATATPFERAGEVIERLEALDELAVAAPAAAFEAGTAASCVWAHDLALPFLAAAVDGLRDQGRLGLLAQALATQAWAAIHVGDVDLALATSEEAVRLGEETRQSRWAAAAIAAQSAMIAEQGDFARAAVLASEAERALLPLGVNPLLSLVQFARGRAALAEGRFADAYLDLRRIADPGDIAHHPFVYAWTLADLIDAGLRGGVEIGEVRRHLDVLESLAKATTAPLLKAQLAFARPLLAADSQVEELFRIAVSRELESWPAWRGRALLAYGAWLRRQQRIADSRSPLREAYELFDRLGFVALSERALQELRASGERKQRRTSETRNRLTPQELQIAQMAAEGLSNRAIGQKLYLSERTVASHLYRVFPKLGISARGQLAAALLRV